MSETKKTVELTFVSQVTKELLTDNPLIQVIIGPRQVGKTTGVSLIEEKLKATYPIYYFSADGEIALLSSWIQEKWSFVQSTSKNQSPILIIDEIQKVENWSEIIKKLWDEQKKEKNQYPVKLVLLGSSSLDIQKGLSESLAGRFNLYTVYHWSPEESLQGYNLTLEQYLIYGGYPGSYRYLTDRTEWLKYVRNSIINPVISKDILQNNKVKSPALFKQCFDLICSYPAQEVSYNKLLGQLHEKGNTDLVKHYLELLEGAFLIKQVFKYSPNKIRIKSSSPKLIPMCPALFSLTLDAELDSLDRGRAFELLIGTLLIRKTGHLFYWSEGNYELDYVYTLGKTVYGLEIKSGRNHHSKSLHVFTEKYPGAILKIVTPENYQEVLNSLPG